MAHDPHRHPDRDPARSHLTGTPITELEVRGMTCHHCVMAVKRALGGVAGVRSAQVDLAGGRARVEGQADLAALLAAVQAEGYEASAKGG